MRKLLTLIIFSAALNSNAGELTSGCQNDLKRTADNYNLILDGIATGKIRENNAEYFLEMNANNAKVVALTCAGLKKISLEGKLFMTASKAEKIANEVKKDAMDYYLDLISQGVER